MAPAVGALSRAAFQAVAGSAAGELVYGGCGRIPDTFYAQLDSGYFYEPMVSVSQLPRCSHVSLQVLSKEFHPPDARREKFGHYFYKPLVFSRCDFSVQCQALQWIHVLRRCPGAYGVQSTFSTWWCIWILRMIPVLLSGARRACPFNASVALGEFTVDASVACPSWDMCTLRL